MHVFRPLFNKLLGWVVLPVLMWLVIIYLIHDIIQGFKQ